MILPIGHDRLTSRRLPIVTIAILALNVLVFLAQLSFGTRQQEARERATDAVVEYYADHPYLRPPPSIGPRAARAARALLRDHDAARPPPDAAARVAEQRELDALGAKLESLAAADPVMRFGYVPDRNDVLGLITSQFLHGGWMHLIGNLWFLWLVGVSMEDAWGRAVFPPFYLLAGVVAALAHKATATDGMIPLVGASGAIAGAMGAFLVRYTTARIRFVMLFSVRTIFRPATFHAPAYVILPLWLGAQLLSAFAQRGHDGGVAYAAHVGGFAFGLVFAIGMRFSGLERRIDEAIDIGVTLDDEGDDRLSRPIAMPQNPLLGRVYVPSAPSGAPAGVGPAYGAAAAVPVAFAPPKVGPVTLPPFDPQADRALSIDSFRPSIELSQGNTIPPAEPGRVDRLSIDLERPSAELELGSAFAPSARAPAPPPAGISSSAITFLPDPSAAAPESPAFELAVPASPRRARVSLGGLDLPPLAAAPSPAPAPAPAPAPFAPAPFAPAIPDLTPAAAGALPLAPALAPAPALPLALPLAPALAPAPALPLAPAPDTRPDPPPPPAPAAPARTAVLGTGVAAPDPAPPSRPTDADIVRALTEVAAAAGDRMRDAFARVRLFGLLVDADRLDDALDAIVVLRVRGWDHDVPADVRLRFAKRLEAARRLDDAAREYAAVHRGSADTPIAFDAIVAHAYLELARRRRDDAVGLVAAAEASPFADATWAPVLARAMDEALAMPESRRGPDSRRR